MPWEYLNETRLDGRFLLIAGFLHGKIRGRHLVDLNCGTARLLRYIPKTFSSYIANDIHQRPDTRTVKLEFYQVRDQEMLEILRGRRVDILMCFGICDSRTSQWESAAVVRVFPELARRHRPRWLVLDEALWSGGVPVLDEVLTEVQPGFRLLFDVSVRPQRCDGLEDGLDNRRVCIMEREA